VKFPTEEHQIGFTGATIGALLVGVVGFSLFGWGGAILGILLGMWGGYWVFGGLIFLLLVANENREDILKGCFGWIVTLSIGAIILFLIVHLWNVR
jgi:hypothetical protein